MVHVGKSYAERFKKEYPFSGAPDRSRTCNLLIRSQVLYPLSYGREMWFINDLGESVEVAEWASVK
jgi:hypothetical protein